MKPLITTIIPTYRRPKMLRRAIRSVLNQTYPHFQVRVYDNASGDETADVVAELASEDPRVKYHCHPRNIGAVGNFHFGMSQVKTPLFAILSDDDWILPSFYELAVASLGSYPQAKFFAGVTINVDDNMDPLLSIPDESFPEGINSPPEGMFRMISGHIPWTSMVFSTVLLKETNILNSPTMTLDYDFEVLAAKQNPFVVSHQPCALYHCHESNCARTISAEDVHSGVADLLGRLLGDDRLTHAIREAIKETMIREQYRFVCTKAYYDFMHQRIPDAARATALLSSIEKLAFKTVVFRSWCLLARLIPGFSQLLSTGLRIRYHYLENKARNHARRKYARLLCNLRPYFEQISEEGRREKRPSAN